MVRVALGHASSSSVCMLSWKYCDVVLSPQVSRTKSRTRFGSMVRRPVMANRNIGHFIEGVVIQKVMFVDAHTVCWVRML